MIQIPLEIGDTILTGRFKNKKVTVKEIGTDDYGNPTINGRSILKIRIPKLYQQQENIQESNMTAKEMKQRMLDLIEKDGTAFELRGAYGNCELWANGNRLEAGSVKDCYNTWIKYRFNPKYEKKINENTLKEGKAVFVKDRNLPSVLKDSGLSFVEYKEYEDLLLSKTVPELRKLQGLVSKQQDKLRKDNPDPNKWPEHIKRADKQLRFRDMMLMAAVDHVAFKQNKTLKEETGIQIGDKIKHNLTGAVGEIVKVSPKELTFKIITAPTQQYGLKPGIIQKTSPLLIGKTYELIKEEVTPFQKSPTEVKIRKDGDRFHIFLQTIDGEQQLSIQGWETKEQAEHAAMMKGYKYDGNPYFEKHKGIEVPKATKSEPVKHEKPKEIDLGKEKELKLENFIREVIKKELNKKKVQLKEEIAVNDAEIEEYAKLVDQIDKMKAELSKLTKRFDELDEKFKKMLDVLESELGESKENFIRYKNILITIKRKGYERTNYKYKEAFDELYKKVNANMKKMIDEVLEANKTITKVSSSLSVQYEANNFITNIFNRVKTWFVSFIGKLRNTNKSTKQLLDQLESKV